MDMNGCGRRRNRSWPEALKREIVAAWFEPGASVSVVARRYEVNAGISKPSPESVTRARFCRSYALPI
jgi:transposase-like protein